MRGAEQDVMSTGERLIYMANQIAKNLVAQGADEAAAMVADHIRAYWDPHMRQRIAELAREQPDALSPIAAVAIAQIAAF